MKKTLSLYLLFLTSLMTDGLTAQTKPDIDKIDDAVVVVMIYDYKGNQVGHGSGFIIDDKGTVITNYHVVKGASSLKIKIDNNGYKETYDVDNIISGNASKDLAKISIKNPAAKKFPFLTLSKTFPTKGEDCWAIGTPADEKYMNTVSKGLVSNIEQYSDPKMLQTNAEITHGSSGGALINTKGEVIGVTSAGDGTEDGARASINFAIWIGEINNLSAINKPSVIDPALIPCELGFYTNSPYTGSVYLYIDGIYVGSFTKYFLNNATPNCHDEGTITRYLYAGVHTANVYYVSTGQWFYGTVKLNPGQCQMYKVGGPTPTYNPNNNNPWGVYERKKFDNKGDYKWVVLSGVSVVETGRGLPLSFYLERSFKENKYSIRSNIQFIYRNSDPQAGIDYSNKYLSFGIDFKKIFNRPYRWNWFISPTFNIRRLNIHHNVYEYQYTSNGYVTIDKSYDVIKNHTFTGLRIGGDRYTWQRFYISTDIGIGYHSFYKNLRTDYNLLLGYRF